MRLGRRQAPRALLAVASAVLVLTTGLLADGAPAAARPLSPHPATLQDMARLVTPADPAVRAALASILRQPQGTAFDAIVGWVARNIRDDSDNSLHGEDDYWQAPAETLALGAGDCEDYAILICSLLRAYGVPADQVYVAVGDNIGGAWHACLAEHYYRGIWRTVDVQGGLDAVPLDTSGAPPVFHIEYYFNDKGGAYGSPAPPVGTYEFSLGASSYPWTGGVCQRLSRRLAAGEKLAVTVDWLPATSFAPCNTLVSYPWSLTVYDADGQAVWSWSGTDLRRTFRWAVPADGDYRLEVRKRDEPPRCLRLRLSPPDWQEEPAAGLDDAPAPAVPPLTAYTPARPEAVPAAPALLQQALDIINGRRAEAKLPPLALGTNPAAQAHAQDMLAHGFLSHYGTDGLKDYMRYALAGGTGMTAESIARAALCWPGAKDALYQQYLRGMVARLEESLLSQESDRRLALDEAYRQVNIGLAYDAHWLYLTQQYETACVSFAGLPEIEGSVLTLRGELLPGMVLSQVQVYYDWPLQALTARQLAYAGAAVPGRPVAVLRPRTGLPYPYTSREISWHTYLDPYTLPPGAPAPAAGSGPVLPPVDHTSLVQYLDIPAWETQGQSFSIQADLSPVLARFGAGVYTVVVCAATGRQVNVTFQDSLVLFQGGTTAYANSASACCSIFLR